LKKALRIYCFDGIVVAWLWRCKTGVRRFARILVLDSANFWEVLAAKIIVEIRIWIKGKIKRGSRNVIVNYQMPIIVKVDFAMSGLLANPLARLSIRRKGEGSAGLLVQWLPWRGWWGGGGWKKLKLKDDEDGGWAMPTSSTVRPTTDLDTEAYYAGRPLGAASQEGL
jgi:hypothetical protein